MARFYADEDFSSVLSKALQDMGHDVITTHGEKRCGETDFEQLKYAADDKRILLTVNRDDYKFHDTGWPHHAGIISITRSTPSDEIVQRIDSLAKRYPDLSGVHINANRENYVFIGHDGKRQTRNYPPRSVAEMKMEIIVPLEVQGGATSRAFSHAAQQTTRRKEEEARVIP